MLAASVGMSCEKEGLLKETISASVRSFTKSDILYFIVASLGIRFY
jgi:hypothetical protein